MPSSHTEYQDESFTALFLISMQANPSWKTAKHGSSASTPNAHEADPHGGLGTDLALAPSSLQTQCNPADANPFCLSVCLSGLQIYKNINI